MGTANISVVVPIYNEEENLPELLAHLRHFSFYEIIFVDGGSTDNSQSVLTKENEEHRDFRAVLSKPGRAKQMNTGAALATGDILLFLHADTRLPNDAQMEIDLGLLRHQWGRFNLKFIEKDFWMSVIAFFINLRSKWTGVATGDQAMFVKRTTFSDVDGFEEIPLMEDVTLSKTLKRRSKPYCSRKTVQTSARRWLSQGRLKTVLLMWKLRWKFYRGVPAEELAKEYRNVR